MVDPQSRRTLVITMTLGLVWPFFGHTILLRVLGTFWNIHTKLVVFMLHHFYNFYINLFLVLGTFWKNSHKAGPDQGSYIFSILWFQKFGKHFQNFNICFKFTILRKSNEFPIFVWKFVKNFPPHQKKKLQPQYCIFLEFLYQPGAGTKADFWLVWGRYVPGIGYF